MNPTQSQDKLRKMAVVRRLIFVAVAIAVVVPYILKPDLPGEPNHWAEKVFNHIEKLEAPKDPNKPRPHVLMAFNYAPSSMAELYPMTRAVILHCFKKRAVPVLMTHDPNAPNLMRMCLDDAAAEASKTSWGKGKEFKSGVDYVNLGFRPGADMLIVNMGENLKGAFAKDIDGKSTQDMPALKGFNSLKDLAPDAEGRQRGLAMDFASSGTTQMWIAYGSDKFGFPLAAGTTAVQAPDLYIYLSSGQLKGFLGGLRGAADYETLLCRSDGVKVAGPATKGMPSQSAVHVMLVLLILGANGYMIYGKFAGKRKV